MPTERPLQTRSRSGSGPQVLNLAGMKQLVGSLCKRHAVAALAAPTACKRTVSGSVSLPCSGCFPPFPHGTGPLSVFWKYLALRDGPRRFRQDSTCPALLRWLSRLISLPVRGYHPLRRTFPGASSSVHILFGYSYYPAAASTATVWALSRSIATTKDIDLSFFSSGY